MTEEIRTFKEAIDHISTHLLQAGPGLAHTCHRISSALRSRVQLKIRRGVSDVGIVQQNRDEFVDAFMAEHPNITKRIEASNQLARSHPPRDFFLTNMDVANIRRALDESDWMFDDNPQESITMWAQQNHDDVLYLDLQRPIEGTSDHQYLTTMQQGKSGAKALASRQGLGSATSATRSVVREPDVGVGAAVMESAFNGADTNLEKPETINLDRVEGPQLAAPTSTSKEGGVYHYDPTQWTHFSIAVMQDCNVEAAIRWGHGRYLQLASTFNCNTQIFPLYTLVAVDDHKKAVPIAFLICSQERADLLQKFLEGRERICSCNSRTRNVRHLII
jgi:hypothetical protein